MFKPGDRVLWSHTLGSVYGKGTVLRAESAKAIDPKAVFCTVVSLENEKGTLVKVNPDDTHPDTNVQLEDDSVVLTSDELIAVEEV